MRCKTRGVLLTGSMLTLAILLGGCYWGGNEEVGSIGDTAGADVFLIGTVQQTTRGSDEPLQTVQIDPVGQATSLSSPDQDIDISLYRNLRASGTEFTVGDQYGFFLADNENGPLLLYAHHVATDQPADSFRDRESWAGVKPVDALNCLVEATDLDDPSRMNALVEVLQTEEGIALISACEGTG